MNSVNQPLLYLAIAIVCMFLCAWLFERAHQRYMPGISPASEDRAKSTSKDLLRMIAGVVGSFAILLALYKTSLLVADLLLIALLVGFAVGLYRIRLRPLLASGLTFPHLAVLIVALVFWVAPMFWFFHLYLAVSYGGLTNNAVIPNTALQRDAPQAARP